MVLGAWFLVPVSCFLVPRPDSWFLVLGSWVLVLGLGSSWIYVAVSSDCFFGYFSSVTFMISLLAVKVCCWFNFSPGEKRFPKQACLCCSYSSERNSVNVARESGSSVIQDRFLQ